MILKNNSYINKISDTTLLALRVVLASAIAMSVSYLFFYSTGIDNFKDRIYWVVLAVISVAASASSSVIYTRAKSIVVFCILGTLTGSLILFCIRHVTVDSFVLVAIVCIIALGLYIYTMFLNYATSVFFIHVYLVMFFGLFIFWGKHLFFTRIFCVIVGTLSIVIITFFTRGQKFLITYMSGLDSSYKQLSDIVNNFSLEVTDKQIIQLLDENVQLREKLTNCRYEFDSTRDYIMCEKTLKLMYELLMNLRTYRVLFLQCEKHNHDLYDELLAYTGSAIRKNFQKLTSMYDKISVKN